MRGLSVTAFSVERGIFIARNDGGTGDSHACLYCSRYCYFCCNRSWRLLWPSSTDRCDRAVEARVNEYEIALLSLRHVPAPVEFARPGLFTRPLDGPYRDRGPWLTSPTRLASEAPLN